MERPIRAWTMCVRSVRTSSSRVSWEKYRVYIIDEVAHVVELRPFNALLKTLEEPPPHVVCIFATTEIHKIPATILSVASITTFRRMCANRDRQRCGRSIRTRS